MEALGPVERRRRERVERLIRLASPVLDLLLATGDRISRLVEREDPEYYPPRTEGMELAPPRTKDARSRSSSRGRS